MSASISELDGVIGYHATTVTPANIEPSAADVLPSMRILPAVRLRRSTLNGSASLGFAAAWS